MELNELFKIILAVTKNEINSLIVTVPNESPENRGKVIDIITPEEPSEFKDNDNKINNLLLKAKVINTSKLDPSDSYCFIANYVGKDLEEFLLECEALEGYMIISRKGQKIKLKGIGNTSEDCKAYLKINLYLRKHSPAIQKKAESILSIHEEKKNALLVSKWKKQLGCAHFHKFIERIVEMTWPDERYKFNDNEESKQIALKNPEYEYKNKWLFLNGGDSELSKEIAISIAERISKRGNYLDFSLSKDVPDIEAGFETLIFYNIETLSSLKQNQLYKMLHNYGYDDKYVIVTGAKDSLLPILQTDREKKAIEKNENEKKTFWVKFNSVIVPAYEEFSNKALEIFIHLLINQDLLYPDNSRYLIAMIEDGNFNYFLKDIESLEYLKKLANKLTDRVEISCSELLSADFWYDILKKIEIVKNESEKKQYDKEYYMKFRGDYWEINFGYDSSMQIKDILGLYYISWLINEHFKNKGFEGFLPKEFRMSITHEERLREFQNKNKIKNREDLKKYIQSSEYSIQEAINKGIEKIHKIERQLNISGSLLSDHLKKSIKPSGVQYEFKYEPNTYVKWDQIDTPWTLEPLQ